MCVCVSVLGGHFDKWPVYGAVTLRMSMGKYFPTSTSVCACVCLERGTMLRSSDCKTVAWCMINQTDWMGQIWFVIAQRGRGSGRGREMDDSVVWEGA